MRTSPPRVWSKDNGSKIIIIIIISSSPIPRGFYTGQQHGSSTRGNSGAMIRPAAWYHTVAAVVAAVVAVEVLAVIGFGALP